MEKIGDYIFTEASFPPDKDLGLEEEEREILPFRYDIRQIYGWNEGLKGLTTIRTPDGGYMINEPFEEFDNFMMKIINKTVGL